MSNSINSLQPSTAKALLILFAAIVVPVSCYADVWGSDTLRNAVMWVFSAIVAGAFIIIYLATLMLTRGQVSTEHQKPHKGREITGVLATIATFISFICWLPIISERDNLSNKVQAIDVIAGMVYAIMLVVILRRIFKALKRSASEG